jgi:hypothetical protein
MEKRMKTRRSKAGTDSNPADATESAFPAKEEEMEK